MKRISTDAEYLDSGKVVIDADGIPIEPAAKSEVENVKGRVSNIEPTLAHGQTGTAWAHVTNDGHRLPLGYSSDGHLDDHAISSFNEDINNIVADPRGEEYIYATITQSGHLLHGVRHDGTVEIPGLDVPAPSPAPSFHFKNGKACPVEADMGTWVGWGSSTMEHMATAFSDLSSKYNSAYIDKSRGGEGGEGTVARLGSRPALVSFPNGTIPPSGSVAITVSNITKSGTMLTYEVDIAGVIGLLKRDFFGDTWEFERTVAGDEVTVPDDTPAIPTHDLAGKFTLLNIGKNTLTSPEGVQEVIDMTDEAFKFLEPLHVKALVINHYGNYGDEYIRTRNENYRRVNRVLAEKFAPIYVDIDGLIMGDRIWELTQITPTQEDLDAQALGMLPPSLQYDASHLNSECAKAVAIVVEEKMTELNWI